MMAYAIGFRVNGTGVTFSMMANHTRTTFPTTNDDWTYSRMGGNFSNWVRRNIKMKKLYKQVGPSNSNIFIICRWKGG